LADHPLAEYITKHLSYHIQLAWDDAWEEDVIAVRWLSAGVNGFLDVLPRAAGRVLGTDRCARLAAAAEAAGDFWLAAVRWAVVAETHEARAPASYDALKRVVALLSQHRKHLTQPVRPVRGLCVCCFELFENTARSNYRARAALAGRASGQSGACGGMSWDTRHLDHFGHLSLWLSL
jgi:hypothetical protein